jgi:hypothetical protein
MVQLHRPAGVLLAVVRATGFAAAAKELRDSEVQQTGRVEIALRRGVALAGRVVAKGNASPVPLARVLLTPEKDADLPDEELPLVQVDAGGSYRFTDLSAGHYSALATADGYAPATRKVEVPAPGDVIFELSPSSFIEGHVMGPDGTPAAGAEVRAEGLDEAAVSSTQGAFALAVSPGRTRLVATLGTFGATIVAPWVGAGASLHGVVLRLQTGAAIKGTVVERRQGNPLAGAELSVSLSRGSAPFAKTIADARGRFAFTALPPGSYELSGGAPGFLSTGVGTIVLSSGQRFATELKLSRAGSIHGVVRDENGKPVPIAFVRKAYGPETDAGDDGSYRLEGLEAGLVWLVATRTRGEDGTDERVELKEGEDIEHDLVVSATGSISGRVMSASKRPLSPRLRVGAHDRSSYLSSRHVEVDSAGHYRLLVPPGTYGVFVEGDRRGPDAHATAIVLAGKETMLDLVVGPEKGPELVAGRVLDNDGSPSSSAEMSLRAADDQVVGYGRSEPDGSFRLVVVGNQPPVLVEAASGGRRGHAGIADDPENVVVQLAAAASLNGRIVADPLPTSFTVWPGVSVDAADGNRKPVDAAHVSFFGDMTVHAQRFVGARFHLDNLKPGRRSLEVGTEDGRSGKVTVDLRAGEEASIDVALVQNSRVGGRIVSFRRREPVTGVRVTCPQCGGDAQTDERGLFHFDNVVPDETWLEAKTADGYWSVSRTFRVEPEKPLDLADLELRPPRPPPGATGFYPKQEGDDVVVGRVFEGSPAEKAGLQAEDVIVRVDGVPVKSVDDIRNRVVGQPNTPVVLSLRRGGAPLTLTIVRAP